MGKFMYILLLLLFIQSCIHFINSDFCTDIFKLNIFIYLLILKYILMCYIYDFYLSFKTRKHDKKYE